MSCTVAVCANQYFDSINKLIWLRLLLKINPKNHIYVKLFFAGFISIFASTPMYFFPALFISLPYFYAKLEKTENVKTAAKYSIAFGLGYFFANTHWIAFSLFEDMRFIILLPLALTVIPLYFSIYLTLCMAIWRYILPNISNRAMQIFAFSLLWILSERLRASMIFPFPWWQIGMTLGALDAWLQPLAVIGINLFSFFAVLLYLIPTILLAEIAKWEKICAICFIALIHTLFLTFGIFRLNHQEKLEIPFNIGLLQTNFTQYQKFHDVQKSLEVHHLQTREIMKNLDKNAQNLIIWPETSIPYSINKDSPQDENTASYLEIIQSEIGKNTKIVFGGVGLDESDNYTNSAFLMGNEKIEKIYDKINLVPFGEYVPLIPIKIGFLPSFSRGKERAVWNIFDKKFVPLICYEILFDKNVKKLHPDYIITISNDGWFGNSIGPHQHFAHARIAAIRNQVPVIRVANTGISAIIDKYGKVIAKIDRKDEKTLIFK